MSEDWDYDLNFRRQNYPFRHFDEHLKQLHSLEGIFEKSEYAPSHYET